MELTSTRLMSCQILIGPGLLTTFTITIDIQLSTIDYVYVNIKFT